MFEARSTESLTVSSVSGFQGFQGERCFQRNRPPDVAKFEARSIKSGIGSIYAISFNEILGSLKYCLPNVVLIRLILLTESNRWVLLHKLVTRWVMVKFKWMLVLPSTSVQILVFGTTKVCPRYGSVPTKVPHSFDNFCTVQT